MKNTVKVDMVNGKIVMDRTFAKNAENPYSDEYKKLQDIRKDYPDFKVIRKTISRNSEKETYKGLTYDYMERYILNHGTDEEINSNLRDYRELRLIGEANKNHAYSRIKSWFLDTFPEIEDFTLPEKKVA